MKFSFKLWLEVDANYDKKLKYRTTHAAYERIDPFAKFFPNGHSRIYFKPMSVKVPAQFHSTIAPENISVEDRAVVTALRNAGYTDIDYVQGYATKGKRVERIGKVLDRLLAAAQTWDDKLNLTTAKKRFMTAPHRQFASASAQGMWIILSQNPHDIAQMSYKRSWVSCMDIENGKFCRSPYAVIRSGGLVAYLINAPEAEVIKLVNDENEYIPSKIAVARVSIKTTINKKTGQAVAVPERRVYPMNIPGFWESVNDWLEKHQEGEPGSYKLYGGYSDNYGRTYHYVPRDHNGLYSYLTSGDYAKEGESLDHILNSHDDFPPPIWDKVKEIVYSGAKIGYQDRIEKLIYLKKQYPHMFSDTELNALPYSVKGKVRLLDPLDQDLFDLTSNNYKPFETNRYVQLNKILDALAQGQTLKTSEALRPLSNWLSEKTHNLKKAEEIKLMKSQQEEVSNKLLNILANQPWEKSFEKFDPYIIRQIVQSGIDQSISKYNIANIEKIINKLGPDEVSYLKFNIRNAYINAKLPWDEHHDENRAKLIADLYERLYGEKLNS